MLCAMCISMFQNPDRKGNHHRKFADLKKAAESGCKICLALMQERNLFGPDEPSEAAAEPFTSYEFSWFDLLPRYWYIRFYSAVSGIIRNSKVFLNCVGPRFESKSYLELLDAARTDLEEEPWRVRDDGFLRHRVPSSTGHPDVAKVALGWLRSCQQSHEECETFDNRSTWLPKRLIDLSRPNEQPRLILSSLERPNSRYATLSHCWGENPSFMTLRSDNLETLRRGIPEESLPKSFKDAILTCRRLGINYLWIDSLCIVQSGKGSREDWLQHASEMQTVYFNCFLNIAIDRACNPDEGAFTERNTDFLQPCHVQWKYSGSEEISWTVHGQKDSATVSCGMTPLSSRAWVLQEKLFSPRVLHFGIDRIWWECTKTSKASISEYASNSYGRTVECFEPYPLLPFKLPDSPIAHQKQPVGNSELNDVDWKLEYFWWNLVWLYSGAELTYPQKDKLVAFGGISKLFSHVFGDDYFAGSFRHQFPWAPLWRVNVQSRRKLNIKEPIGYQAPSWSWASVNVRVSTLPQKVRAAFISAELLAKVDEVDVELVDKADKYGQVSFGELTLRSILLPCTPDVQVGKVGWEFERGFDWEQFLEDFEVEAYKDLGIELVVHQNTNPEITNALAKPPAKSYITISFYPDNPKAFSEHRGPLFALPICERFQKHENFNASKYVVPDGQSHSASDGLILKRSLQFEGKYERVGYYRAKALLAKPLVDQGQPEVEVKIV